jgi:hypothetical protein
LKIEGDSLVGGGGKKEFHFSFSLPQVVCFWEKKSIFLKHTHRQAGTIENG